MKKHLILGLALFIHFLSVTLSYGQNQAGLNKFDLKGIIPSSPEAAMLGRFGEIPIGYYTGTADVSIPFYNLKQGGLELPIVLRYHGSGIKVEDEASNVGLGWSLEPGGSIIQVVSGKEDGASGDLLPSRDPSGYNYLLNQGLNSAYFERRARIGWDCVNPLYDDSPTTFAFMEQGEGQPDIYIYNFGGYSGKFAFHPVSGQIILLDKKADISFSGGQGGWTAKTMDGTTYLFTTIEYSTVFGSQDRSSITSKLTKIIAANGKEINFEYADGFYGWTTYGESFHSEQPLGLGDDNNYVKPRLDYAYHYTKTLTKITSDNVEVVFNLENRVDIDNTTVDGINPVKRIGSIDIKNRYTGQKTKTLNFNYDYFTSNSIGGNYLDAYLPTPGAPKPITDAISKRLKLLSVQEVGYNELNEQLSNPPYTFTYNESIQLPLKTSFARDFWGYYNGQSNSKLTPNLSFYYYSEDTDYLNMPPAMINSVNGANRTPDSSKMQAGMLKKISYPTGGSSEFEYETHQFGNHIYPDINLLNATAISGFAHDTNSSADVSAYSFTVPHAQNITFHNIITRGPNSAVSFYDIQPATITLSKTVNGVTTVVKAWQMFAPAESSIFDQNGGTFTWKESLNIPFESGAQYQITTSLPDALGPQNIFPNYASVSSSFTYETAIPQNVLTASYGGGLRVKSIRNYSSNGQLANNKLIKYVTDLGGSSGKLMTPLKSLFKRTMFGAVPTSAVNLTLETRDVWFIGSESVIPFSSAAGGNMVGYSRVEENDLDASGEKNGRHVYDYHNMASIAHANIPENPDLLNGMLEQEKIYDNTSNIPLVQTNYTYLEKQSSYFNGVKAVPTYLGPSPCDYLGGNDGYSAVSNQQVYIYPIWSHWYVLQSKETLSSFAGSQVAMNENYTYNAKGQLVKTEQVNSAGIKKTLSSLYPIDNPSNPMSGELISRNLFDYPMEQTTFSNDVNELSKNVINYKVDNGIVVQDDLRSSFLNASPPVTEVTFDSYGNFASLEQFTKKRAVTSILWSFANSKPIAEIRNASLVSLQNLLGAAEIQNFAALVNPSATEIDDFLAPLRANLPEAFVTSYTYQPLVGMTSQTDAKGMTTYYEYDGFQRLKYIRNQDKDIIKSYCYNYSGQLTDCNGGASVSTFYNVLQSGSFTRNNCGAGIMGSTVVYSIAAGSYTSTVSQADADAQALAAMNADGQAFANANGGCNITFSSIGYTSTFQKTNCSAGATGSMVTFTVPAGRFTSSVSQEDADVQAANAMLSEGPAYANMHGSCIYYNTVQSRTIAKNDCGNGGPLMPVVYTVAAGAYSASSQAAADQLAINDIDANGQAYANLHGSCALDFTLHVDQSTYAVGEKINIYFNYTGTQTVQFEVQVTNPDGSVEVFAPQARNIFRMNTMQSGSYMCMGRTINSSGVESSWLPVYFSVN